MNIAIVNESEDMRREHKAMSLMTKACDIQLRKHASIAYDTKPGSVKLFDSIEKIPKNYYVIAVIDNPDEAQALGYHFETPDGRPYGKVFTNPILDNGGTIFESANSISCTLSHEILELWWDPQVNIWYEGPDGNLYSGELCDSVESDAYPIKVQGKDILVSNFVLPPFFDANPEKGAKFDWLGKLKKPFTMTEGGYMVIKGPRGGTKEVYAKKYPEYKKDGKKHPAARTARRHGR
jgi:hypothetical protein